MSCSGVVKWWSGEVVKGSGEGEWCEEGGV